MAGILHPQIPSRSQSVIFAGLVLLAGILFSAGFAWINTFQYRLLSPWFEQNATHTTWGIIQRLYLIIPCGIAAVVRPRQVGFQVGKIRQHIRMLAVIFILNVGLVGGYLAITGATPYSGLELIFNEVVTVPAVEELVWRGVVFAVLMAVLQRQFNPTHSSLLAGVISGICFGLLHSTNALFGYPLAFVLVQTANALVWGIVYGIVRAKTGSIYPSMGLHAAMNLAAALA